MNHHEKMIKAATPSTTFSWYLPRQEKHIGTYSHSQHNFCPTAIVLCVSMFFSAPPRLFQELGPASGHLLRVYQA